jgi:transposase
MRYELIDYEWTAIKPFLPNKPRGVPRVNDRRVLNGIFWVLLRSTVARSAGRLWPVHHLLQSLRTLATGGRLGWAYEALAATHDAAVQMIDTSIVRVHQHAACIIRNKRQIRHLVTTGDLNARGLVSAEIIGVGPKTA